MTASGAPTLSGPSGRVDRVGRVGVWVAGAAGAIVMPRRFVGRPHEGRGATTTLGRRQHGLDATFESYGADYAQLEHLARQPNYDRLHAMVELVPEAHRRFIRGLPA